MNTCIGHAVHESPDAPKRSGSFSFGGRRTWLVLAALALVGGAAMNWSWLVAIGVAPLLLALAPCAAMCAIGVCIEPGAEGCKRSHATIAPAPPPGILLPLRGRPARAACHSSVEPTKEAPRRHEMA
jgi:hypothetical protein